MISCKAPLTRRNKPIFAGKVPLRIKLPLAQIHYLRDVRGYRSAGHIMVIPFVQKMEAYEWIIAHA